MTQVPMINRRRLMQAGAGFAVLGAAKAVQTYRLMVFSNPAAGREDEYNHWYDNTHLPQVVSVPGFVRARRLVMAGTQLHPSPVLAKYLAYFEIQTDDIEGVFYDVNNRIKAGRTKMSSVFSPVGAHSRTYRLQGPERLGASGPLSAEQDAADGFHFVFGTPLPGKDAAFNAWYDTEHLPDMVTVPGFLSGQRAALSPIQLVTDPTAAPYLAIFRIQSGDMAKLDADFMRVVPHLRSRPVMKTADGYTFVPHGPILIGDEVRARLG